MHLHNVFSCACTKEGRRKAGRSLSLKDGAEVEVDGEERIAYFGGSGALVALTLVVH